MWLNCVSWWTTTAWSKQLWSEVTRVETWLFYFVIFWLVQREEKLCMLQIKWVRYKGKAAGLNHCILNIFLEEGKWNFLSWHWWQEKERFVFGVDIVHFYCSISCLLLISSSQFLFFSFTDSWFVKYHTTSFCMIFVSTMWIVKMAPIGNILSYFQVHYNHYVLVKMVSKTLFLLPADFLGSLFATSFFPSHSSCSLLDGTTLLSANDIRNLMRYCCFPLW